MVLVGGGARGLASRAAAERDLVARRLGRDDVRYLEGSSRLQRLGLCRPPQFASVCGPIEHMVLFRSADLDITPEDCCNAPNAYHLSCVSLCARTDSMRETFAGDDAGLSAIKKADIIAGVELHLPHKGRLPRHVFIPAHLPESW